MVVVKLDDILWLLRDFFSKRDNVKPAILFGSIVRNGVSSHDIDIALRFSGHDASLLDLGELISSVAGVLGLSIEMVNIVDLDMVNSLLV